MSYNLETIETIAGCDALITTITNDLENAQFRVTALGRQIANRSNAALALPAELNEVNVQLEALNNTVTQLPPGPSQTAMLMEINILENQKMRLESRSENLGPEWLVEIHVDKAIAESSVVVFTDALTQAQARKTALQAAGIAA